MRCDSKQKGRILHTQSWDVSTDGVFASGRSPSRLRGSSRKPNLSPRFPNRPQGPRLPASSRSATKLRERTEYFYSEAAVPGWPRRVNLSIAIQRGVSLKPFSTLRAGGDAELFCSPNTLEELASLALEAQKQSLQILMLGYGSNILPSDDGVAGLTIVNRTRNLQVVGNQITVDAGALLQDLFLASAQQGLSGLEFAVGIPGTVGGALVSNAGAYRSNISEHLKEIEVVKDGSRMWIRPDWLQLSYRDSILRGPNPPQCTLLRLRFELPGGRGRDIYDLARENQRQRISKQPAPASAGSFFKNVYDLALAQSLTNLPDRLRSAGVVPAGYLLEHTGLIGYRHEGAAFARRHANFIVNIGGATASAIRQLAFIGKRAVREKFNVELEEEVLYVGDWGRWLRHNES